MKKCILLLAPLLLLACKNNLEPQPAEENSAHKGYTLIEDDVHILVETFDSLQTDVNRYNLNNKVFTVGTSFTYSFKHLTQQGDTLLFALDTQNQSKWHFVKKEKADSLTIDTVVITVLDGNPMADRMPDYNQTNLKYQLQNTRSYSTSGVIENEGNIWMHPPRQAYFRILELNPFPYIKAPYEVGTAWTWSLDIGSAWGDERWKTWEGGITNTYTYTITDERILPTAMGNLKCYLIKAEATSDLGKTSLLAYFNETYGFITLDYTNIDGSKTLLELTAHSN